MASYQTTFCFLNPDMSTHSECTLVMMCHPYQRSKSIGLSDLGLEFQTHQPKQTFLYFVSILYGVFHYSDAKLTNTARQFNIFFCMNTQPTRFFKVEDVGTFKCFSITFS
jgi:hypothetical protein